MSELKRNTNHIQINNNTLKSFFTVIINFTTGALLKKNFDFEMPFNKRLFNLSNFGYL